MGIWRMTESLDELESLYCVHASEEATYRSFRNDRRRKEWLTVRILLRELIGDKAEIRYLESGKPYLSDRSKCISITHTIGYVGIRLATHPVALDMEYKSDRVLHLIPRFVDEQEMKYIEQGNETVSALIIWRAKETLFKLFDFADIQFDKDLCVSNLRASDGKGFFKGAINKGSFSADVSLRFETTDDLILVYC